MLPICFGEATKFSQFLLDANKHYQVEAQLGVRTTTCDAEGEIVEIIDASSITLANMDPVLQEFSGTIEQVPSMFSALKHQGVPLYKLARQGIEVERKARTVHIESLSMLDFNEQQSILRLDVKCSKGTYVRNLVDDIGQVLGCGAHVTMLHRLSVASFTANQMVSLDKLEMLRQETAFAELDALILPLETISQTLPKINLTTAAAFRLRQGQLINDSNIKGRGLVSLSSENNHFFGIGEIVEEGVLAAKRLVKG